MVRSSQTVLFACFVSVPTQDKASSRVKELFCSPQKSGLASHAIVIPDRHSETRYGGPTAVGAIPTLGNAAAFT